MKKSRIVLVEIGMLSCVIIAAIFVPERTPLQAFLAVSSEFLLIGNYLLVKIIEDAKVKKDATKKRFWTLLLLVFVIINIPWVLSQLLNSGR